MRHTKIAGLFAALLALGAVFAAVASATAKPTLLTLKTAKGVLATGAAIKAESSNLIFVTSAGNLECSTNVLTGTVTKNNETKDTGSVTAESSTGHETDNECKTTTPLGPAEIKSSGFPWPITFTDKGVAEVKGTKKVIFTSVFPGAGVTCVFEASKVKASFTIGGPLKITTSNQVFKANKKTSGAACPKEGKLSGEFSLTSSGETIESELTAKT
jgi:hypothetical protein